MKTAALVLLLPAGGFAFAQFAPQKPAQPGPQFQMPQQFSQPPEIVTPHTFRLDPRQWMPSRNVMVVMPMAPRSAFDTKVDPQMIVRPPKDSFAQHEPRAPIPHDLYPELKLLPTEEARLEPIPITWPDFKPEPVPITWPKAKELPTEDTRQDAMPRGK